MKSLALDSSGDLLLENNSFQMVYDNKLLRQKVQEVINTNKGEWPFNWEQGITFANILGKGTTRENVQAEIIDGLNQVDESLTITEFFDSVKERKRVVDFKATKDDGNTEINILAKY